MTGTIKLEGRDFAIAPLKFRDLKRVLPLFLKLGIESEEAVDAQGEIVTAGIRAADQGFTRAAFDELAPTIRELQDAVTAIALLSGLEPKRTESGTPLPGEVRAAS